MGLSCRICKKKFSVPLTLEEEPSQDFNITTVKCGHVFHQKCLEASLTHQKLSHAMHGTGPFRKLCPVFQCGTLIELEGDVIRICVTPEELQQSNIEEHDLDSIDSRLTKQLQRLSLERDEWKSKVDDLRLENEILNDAMYEIKNECDEMRSFLHEAEMIQKGDRVFWLNPEGSFSPAKIIELRQKSSRSMPYAVIKLEKRKRLSSSSGRASQAERESFVVPANELLSFKSFFKEYFDEFSYKLRMIMSEMIATHSDLASGKSFRKISKKRSSAGEISTNYSSPNFSFSHEAIDKLIVEHLDDPSTTPQNQAEEKRATFSVSRRKTIHSGSSPNKVASSFKSPGRIRPLSHSYPNTSSLSDFSAPSFDSNGYGSVFNSPIRESSQEESQEYISIGERVIWYGTYSEHPEVGNVAALLQYTKCAIVKFDKLPQGPKQLEFRTVPVHQLFPYDLASPEEKFKISVVYEFTLDNDEDEEDKVGNYGTHESDEVDYNYNLPKIVSNYAIENSINPPSSIDTSSESEMEERNPLDAITSTLFALFYSTNVFERNLLDINLSDDEKQINIKQILTVDIIPSLKVTGDLSENLVRTLLSTLEYGIEDYIQPQEFLVNVFEDSLKLKPFITFVSGKQQSVLQLTIPEYHYEGIMFAGENNEQPISFLEELFFKTLETSGDQLANVPSPAFILNVNRPRFSHGSFIVPPFKFCLDPVLTVNKDFVQNTKGSCDTEEDLCSCNNGATWKCRTCLDTVEGPVQGFCDDCRHIAAEVHKDSDHFPLLTCSREGGFRKLKLHSVICKSKTNSYSAFMKYGMAHSDSWVLCQPSLQENNSKIIAVGSIQSWLESLESDSQESVIPEEIPPYVLKLLKEGSVFIYCPYSN